MSTKNIENSPEMIILREIPENGISIEQLYNLLGHEVIIHHLGICLKNKYVKKQGNLIILNKDLNDV
jgi:hypothetical protein